MRRVVVMIAVLAIVGTSCSGGLSDAERVWCSASHPGGGDRDMEVASAARILGLGVELLFAGPSAERPEETPGTVILGYSLEEVGVPGYQYARISQSDYERACKAAFGSQIGLPVSVHPEPLDELEYRWCVGGGLADTVEGGSYLSFDLEALAERMQEVYGIFGQDREAANRWLATEEPQFIRLCRTAFEDR